MATIKALEGRTIHQIQSGQVIVDLCSVVKELVENSLDAEATSIEVRFKNNGISSIEVQDNGIGISSDNYETVALKHYTSKLASYDDLPSLQTFGFRGEALSSLCALSKFHIVTAQANQAPKGTRLDFETSGKLKATSVVASQKGTMVIVEDLFINLPVRRRELEKNIKREYGKVLGLLQAYACISTEARISTSNVMAKGKKAVVFATKSNSTTRENIANVFGTKALPTLVAMDLHFDLQPTSTLNSNSDDREVQILGHVSRPVFGEGRNAPDRQMFFVNTRPCSLPQVAKVFNEVYKLYNVSQSPFILANITIDTNAYDVNVSPDKRTIMLHDQSILLESLRTSLIELFEKQDQTVPQTQKTMNKMSAFKQLSDQREGSKNDNNALPERGYTDETADSSDADDEEEPHNDTSPGHRPDRIFSRTALPDHIANFAERETKERVTKRTVESDSGNGDRSLSKDKQKLVKNLKRQQHQVPEPDDCDNLPSLSQLRATEVDNFPRPVEDFNERLAEQRVKAKQNLAEPTIPSQQSDESEEEPWTTALQPTPKPSPGVVPNAFDRMRSRRQSPEVATITIGSKTTSTLLGESIFKKRRIHTHSPPAPSTMDFHENESSSFNREVSQRMQAFASPGINIVKISDSTQSKPRASRPQFDDTEEAEEEPIMGSPFGISNGIEAADSGNESGLAETDGLDGQSRPSLQDAESDEEYVDGDEKKAREDAKVADLIRHAEETESVPKVDMKRRAHQILKGTRSKDSTAQLIHLMDTSIRRICQHLETLESTLRTTVWNAPCQIPLAGPKDTIPPEDRLTLTVSRDDFTNMHIIGQFNLGFILATRTGTDVFIIDQHASDEKYNFERLQSTTVVQNQRLVHPRRLELTAVDEEIILENGDALLKNGFQVEIDHSGSEPVGQRCKLLSLPMSKEVTFDTSDLEELVALLADSSSTTSPAHIPRPSKVCRMFAMRACRSSIMIGKTLTTRQMQGLLKHMGEIDKPWNCPHGRPTMRHVCGLGDWTKWKEGDGLGGMEEQPGPIDWGGWIERVTASGSDEDVPDVVDGDGTIELAVGGEEGDILDAEDENED